MADAAVRKEIENEMVIVVLHLPCNGSLDYPLPTVPRALTYLCFFNSPGVITAPMYFISVAPTSKPKMDCACILTQQRFSAL